jgi:quercetin dioxygenase-like cupin family protein
MHIKNMSKVMNKKIKIIAPSLVIFFLIIGSFTVEFKSSAQNKINMGLKPQVFEIPSLFDKGLKNGDPDMRSSTLVHTDKVEVVLRSLTRFPNHYHEHENHFLYVLKGKAYHRIGAIKTVIKAGDLIVLPAGKQYEHELKVIGDQPMQLLVFGVPPEE